MEVNKIYNEDCLTTMTFMDPQSVSVILTSPPYNMTKRKGGWGDKGRYDKYKDWLDEEEYLTWTLKMFKNFDRILQDNGVVLYNFSYSIENPSLPYKLVSKILDSTNFVIADTIIWKKKMRITFPASSNRLNRKSEFVFVFVRSHELETFTTNKKVLSVSSKGQKYYECFDNIIEADNNDGSNPLNKATFSTELVTKLLDIYAPDGSLIYDPFIGVGTTGHACNKRGLDWVGSEISEKQIEYFNGNKH
jgi:site-specific DNA-methyltransferase (adenine-specific)/modification methylase